MNQQDESLRACTLVIRPAHCYVDCSESHLGNRLGCEVLSAVDAVWQLSAWVSLWICSKLGPQMSFAICFLPLKRSWQSAKQACQFGDLGEIS